MVEYSTGETFREDITGPVVLVMFSTSPCSPCRVMLSYLDTLKCPVFKVDVEADPALAAEYRVQMVPTLALFRNGILVSSRTGLVPQSFLQPWIDNHMKIRS